MAKGQQYTVMAYNYHDEITPSTIDMRNNWWGTSDPDSIQAWILDGNDNDLINAIVEWDPYNDSDVAVEENSLGGLKSMFR